MVKAIRCVNCNSSFTEADVQYAKACPTCGSKSVPALIEQDLMVAINWHELRILTNWATFYADENLDLPQQKMLASLIGRLSKQGKQGWAPLTLREELGNIQEEYPEAELLDSTGKVIVKGKKEEIEQ